MVKEIGGYFEFELNLKYELHSKAIALNSARNCLIYILKTRTIDLLHIPFFNCESIYWAISEFLPDLKVVRYNIDNKFRPILPMPLGENEGLLYINYFGICESIIQGFSKEVIIDNSQSFYLMPYNSQDTFYSPRKFFGVPDGGYLYSRTILTENLERAVSINRTKHLLMRIDYSAQEGYGFFMAAEKSINHEPMMQMSMLTKSILSSIDYDNVSKIRRSNFIYLHNILGKTNELEEIINISLMKKKFVPFVYPYMKERNNYVRKKLIANKVYVAKYWPPELLNIRSLSEVEKKFVRNILPLPIDQRY